MGGDDAREVEAASGRPLKGTKQEPDRALGTIFRILGRTSVDIIKSGGYKISGLEIESVLLQHEKIRECAVVGKPDETWGEKVTAVCVLESGTSLDIKELRDWGKERMASYKARPELQCWLCWLRLPGLGRRRSLRELVFMKVSPLIQVPAKVEKGVFDEMPPSCKVGQ
ncbi:unnamed protein product [Effrenium voratum]|nr:unnamed protein product [Effrenium voratum]